MHRIDVLASQALGVAPSDAPADAPSLHVVIVGGVAGGATAAARVRRLDSHARITIVEAGPDVSFASCGMPYYIGGEIADRARLLLQTPGSLAMDLRATVLTRTVATAIDTARRELHVRRLPSDEAVAVAAGAREDAKKVTDQLFAIRYDRLLLSPGAEPLRPAGIRGVNDPRVATLRTMRDMDTLLERARAAPRIAVVGAGFIGLELIEQLWRLRSRHEPSLPNGTNNTGSGAGSGALELTLVEAAPAVLPAADAEIASFLHGPLQSHGVRLVLGDAVTAFDDASGGASGPLTVRLARGAPFVADLVVLAIGIRPTTALAVASGLRCDPKTGHILVDSFMRTSAPDVYAVGDAVAARDAVFPERFATAALGNVANMQARVAADHAVLAGGASKKGAADAKTPRLQPVPYRGSLGTAIVRAFDCVVGVTGWSERRLRAAGISGFDSVVVTGVNHAGYYPQALPLTVKIVFDVATGRILGGQAVGQCGVDKRVDVIATAITGGLTIDALSMVQLSYAPPFGAARDVANVAALAARNVSGGLCPAWRALGDPHKTYIDVRSGAEARAMPLPGAINIPNAELTPERVKRLDRGGDYVTVCLWGRQSYFAARKLLAEGLNAASLIGGLRLHDARFQPH